MNDRTKRELKAVCKIVYGGIRVASGIATGLGKGFLGTYCRNHNLTQYGLRLAKSSIEAGCHKIDEGWRELKT